MHHTINRVVLQGSTGPPTVRLSPDGLIFASAELQIEDHPDVTITVSGYGINAAGIAEPATGKILRVTGMLCFDLASQSFYVLAGQVRRMEPEGGVLVPRTPSMNTFDRFERLFLDPEDTPATPT